MSDGPPKYLRKYGLDVIQNGYRIVPIVRGSKAPGLGHPAKKWSTIHADPDRLQKWLDQGYDENGIGIITAATPGVDVDCQDDTVTAHMRQFIIKRLGDTIERVGLAPKTLFLYRTDEPFTKITSDDFIDSAGRKARLEVLGDGQQFVALAIHPDTRKPYRWKDKKGPHNTPVASLPTITREDAVAIKAEFERIARERGWQTRKTLKRLEGPAGRIDYDNPFLQDAHKVEDLSPEQLRARLQLVPGAEEYETWFQIGMALYHQFDGSDEGLMLWDEWSSTAMNYSAEAVSAKWPTFEIEGKGRAPVTARLIIKLAAEAQEELATEKLEESLAGINRATTIKELIAVCEPIKGLAFDKPTRAMLAGKVQERYKMITNTRLGISDARDMIRFENPENKNTPAWLIGFVYVQFDKKFYNYKTRQNLDTQAFDQSFGRYMMTVQDQLEGRSSPEHPASHVALNRYQIPTVTNRMYMPNEDVLFSVNGESFVNTYSRLGIPEVPETISLSGKIAIAILKKHMEHLFEHEKDRELLLDWFAWVVQTGQRVSWCPLIQGVQSDGKSWFASLLMAVLGMDNVMIVPGTALNEKYTGWAEGHQIVFIEEVRLHGKDRYAAVNNLKPYITNPRVPIRRMNVDTYNILNQTSYVALTNYRDGIPADAGDTRYFPMFSRYQSREALAQFKEDNPEYYNNLFAAIEEAGALRKFFLERDIDPTFAAVARAPESAHRQQMVDLSRDDETEALMEALEDSTQPDFSKILLDTLHLNEAFTGRGVAAPMGRRQKMLLSEMGFWPLGRVKIGAEYRRFWTMEPSRFQKSGETNTEAVRLYLEFGDL